MLNSTVYYNLFFKDYSMSIATAGATPAASSATTYYLNNIGKVQTIDECMNNTNLYTNAMTGYGLGDMLNEKDLVRQALEQRVSTSKALPNTRRSRNFKALTTALNSQANGSSATNTTAAATGTISKYDEKALDSQIGQQSPGVEMSLYFQQNVGDITSGYSIGETTLLKVVETALGPSRAIPEEILILRLSC